ncbi:MAG: hypothetical protein ABIT68_03795 [Sphingomicrobium sp.]
MVRAASGHAGTTIGTPPAIITANRPRLNAIASSRGSSALKSAVTRIASGSKRTATARLAELVQMTMLGAEIALLCEMFTCRDILVQRIISRAMFVLSMNRASLPPGNA